MEPLRAANIVISPGYGDLMTLARTLAHVHAGQASSKLRVLLPYIVSLGGTIVCALWLAVKKLEEHLEFAIILTLTLLLYPHLDYDFVVLLYPLAFVLRSTDMRRQIPCIATICALWYGPTVVSRLHFKDSLGALVVNALLLIVLTYSLARLGSAEKTSPQSSSRIVGAKVTRTDTKSTPKRIRNNGHHRSIHLPSPDALMRRSPFPDFRF